MSWWEWALLWTVLVLGGLAVLGWLAWGVFRAGLRLIDTLVTAQERVFGVLDALEDLAPDGPSGRPGAATGRPSGVHGTLR